MRTSACCSWLTTTRLLLRHLLLNRSEGGSPYATSPAIASLLLTRYFGFQQLKPTYFLLSLAKIKWHIATTFSIVHVAQPMATVPHRSCMSPIAPATISVYWTSIALSEACLLVPFFLSPQLFALLVKPLPLVWIRRDSILSSSLFISFPDLFKLLFNAPPFSNFFFFCTVETQM